MVLRSALTELDVSEQKVVFAGSVVIRHPGVGAILFIFPAYSRLDFAQADSSQCRSGVCHILALDACRVVTNHAANNCEDFLARDREGKIPIPIDDVSLLTCGDYYYFLSPPESPTNPNYPVVKRFSAFVFPSQIPDNWHTARASARWTASPIQVVSPTNISDYVVARDQCCIATKYRNFTRCAHLVPKAEAAWFMANEMIFYSPGNEHAGVDTHANGILLRDDVLRCLDSHAFVFYPAGDDQFMTYFVQPNGYPDYTELLHERLVTIHPTVAVEYLYARFAYAVIHLLRMPAFFESVPDNPMVKVAEEGLALQQAVQQVPKAAKFLAISEDTPISEASESENAQVSRGSEDSDVEDSYADGDGDARWRARLLARLPEFATLDEVEHPPEGVCVHMETPHMLRVKSEYIRENPQVWQTSATPEGTVREDEEGFLAKWMTRPT